MPGPHAVPGIFFAGPPAGARNMRPTPLAWSRSATTPSPRWRAAASPPSWSPRLGIADGAAAGVIAHTLPERNASCAVLNRNGFTLESEIIDPEDGPVWRWCWRG